MNRIVYKNEDENIVKFAVCNGDEIITMDLDIYEKYCKSYCWYVYKDSIIRIRATINKSKFELHRFIYMCVFPDIVYEGLEIDHKTGDRLDNRLSNLRVLSRKSNALNKKKIPIRTQEDTGYLICYEHDGERITKRFLDKDFGSKDNSYLACKKYIDNEYKKIIDDKISGIEKRRMFYEFQRGIKGLKNTLPIDVLEYLAHLFLINDEYIPFNEKIIPDKDETLINKILNMHKNKITKGADGRYSTYVGKGKNRKKLVRTDIEKLHCDIVNYYTTLSNI